MTCPACGGRVPLDLAPCPDVPASGRCACGHEAMAHTADTRTCMGCVAAARQAS